MRRSHLAGWAFVFILVFVLQSLFYCPAGLMPDFMLLVVFFFSRRYGEVPGLLFGASTGLVLDLFSGLIVGPHLLARGISGYMSGWFSKIIFGKSRLLIIGFMIILSLVNAFVLKTAIAAFIPPSGRADLIKVAASGAFLGLVAAAVDLIWIRDTLNEEQPI